MIGGTMNNHPLEQLIRQYLAKKDITKGTWELYNTVLKQYTSSYTVGLSVLCMSV